MRNDDEFKLENPCELYFQDDAFLDSVLFCSNCGRIRPKNLRHISCCKSPLEDLCNPLTAQYASLGYFTRFPFNCR